MIPSLSVVLPVPVRYELIRRTVRHLREQTIADRIELVLVAPRGRLADLRRDELAGFGAIQTLEIDDDATLTVCRVTGARAATALIIAFAEDHSFPVPMWAETLVRLHGEGWDAVAPAFENGNPGTTLSWADIFLAFGTWVGPLEGGEMPRLPWHNTSYKRALLLEHGDRLALVLEVESVLQDHMRAKGHRLFLARDVSTRHVNFSRVRPFLTEYLVSGRLFGGRRAEAQRWSPVHRLVYIVGAPLIPFKRIPEVVSQIRQTGRAKELMPRVLPAVVLGLIAHSLGEMVGYALGAGNAGLRKSAMEFDRGRFVVAADRAVLAP